MQDFRVSSEEYFFWHLMALSPRFCASDYDLTLESCDHVTFRVHKSVLEKNSHGFGSPEHTISEPDTPVVLSETSSVLELLLQYLYPGPQPSLKKVEFIDLAGLAEAAQKYEVWSAMEVSKLHMRNAIPAHGFEVLIYAAKHDFDFLADEAVEYSCWVPMADAVDKLNPKYFRAFAKYFDQYRSCINRLVDFRSYCHWDEHNGAKLCIHWAYTVNQLHIKLLNLRGPLAKVREIFEVPPQFDFPDGNVADPPCFSCYLDMEGWRSECDKELRWIKKMSTFFVN